MVSSFIEALQDGQSKAGSKSFNALIAKIKETMFTGNINECELKEIKNEISWLPRYDIHDMCYNIYEHFIFPF